MSRLGVSVTPLPPCAGTVKAIALLHAPFCWTRAMPVTAADATCATTCVSLQLATCPAALPSQATPLPCEEPNPVPVMVTEVPGPPEAGSTPVM